MVKFSDVQTSNYTIGFCKLTGRAIKELHGYLSCEFGPDVTFKVCHIELDDGTTIDVEGEHDFPYLPEGYPSDPPNLDQATLNRLYLEENPDEDDEDE